MPMSIILDTRKVDILKVLDPEKAVTRGPLCNTLHYKPLSLVQIQSSSGIRGVLKTEKTNFPENALTIKI